MLWKPVTSGEEAFLFIYKNLGRQISVTPSKTTALDFLYSEADFQEFIRLNATLEVFIRSLRGAMHIYESAGHLPPGDFGRRMSKGEFVVASLTEQRIFCEVIKSAAETALRGASPAKTIAAVVKASSPICYICGVQFQAGHKHNAATLDHLWPLSLGGASMEENLLPACADCNQKRGNAITWAWGPVQSTDYKHDLTRNPPFDLRFSLATSRLMIEASGRNGGGRSRTLKDAAVELRPLFSDLAIKDGRHRVYFELVGNLTDPV